MQYLIKAPKHIDANVELPASKSISNRALIIYALSGAKVAPENLSDCDDTEVIVKAIKENPYTIDIKAAGTAMRFMTAYLSTQSGEHVLTGTARMKQRPIKVLVDALRRLGADISYLEEEGYPPLKIKGKRLNGGKLEITGKISSQYITALLLIAPTLVNGLELKLTDTIVSRPYIDLTLYTMRQYGVKADWSDIDTIKIEPQKYVEAVFKVENDWTATSYWYAVVALMSDPSSVISFSGLMNGSQQGDSAAKYIYSLLGVKTKFSHPTLLSDVVISKNDRIVSRLEYDFTNQPDLAQTFIALCPILNIPFVFKGLASLMIKETNRIEAMCNEMRKLGYVLSTYNHSEIHWDGERCECQENPIIETYEDHRMAMAFAPLSVALGEIRIKNPEVITKSYPNYWQEMKKAGFSIIEE